MTDEQIKQIWVDAWQEQNTRVEPDNEEVEALKSFLAKAKQHYEHSEYDPQAELFGRLIERGWIPPEEARQKRLDRPEEEQLKMLARFALVDLSNFYKEKGNPRQYEVNKLLHQLGKE